MLKKLIALSTMTLSLFVVSSSVLAVTPTGKTILERANNAYNSEKSYTVLHINQGKVEKEFKYKEAFIPIKDLFNSRVSGIKWDNKNKIAEVTNAGSGVLAIPLMGSS
ncbi:hypothetical protein COLU111180_08875 [Cohnella lubricantis]|uniref:Copper amine oxidase-like N-terminal domain-containing protein n=1 Tax=Cohnella lubricantis TaxID=2163172 RepID=A0A841T6B6_9BACL|nr:hypothetical protein [Cohnella lubricantis]MBB6676874.1 hypothetical protein [Cohnella lubricantis]MBP2118274.1 hypothetical protein [Cohnella lubricantis]